MLIEPLTAAPLPAAVCDAFLDAPGCLLFDSAGGLPSLARYSYLTADPFLLVTADADGLFLRRGGAGHRLTGDPFYALGGLLRDYQLPMHDNLPPFQGGAAGYWGYELGRAVERLPGRAAEDLPLPRLWVGFYDWVLAHDHQLGRSWVVATGLPNGTGAAARRRAEWVYERLGRGRGYAAEGATAAATSRVEGSTFSRVAYEGAVDRVKAYIVAGDVYQVNLSQRLHAPLPCAPWPLYQRLRRVSPAPFGAFLRVADHAAILSASPERFLRLDGRRVETRPIKGTRPRGETAAEDVAWRDELRCSEKDRAENLMIVDLMRNDLGRVCRSGSVRVPQLFALEAHPTVWQQVSVVTGELEGHVGAIDLLRACFPGGSVTGAPKIRAMEIIDELEPVARGVYCGAIGYIAFNGAMDTSIPIRTIVATGDTAYINVGGGIVADSDPAEEYRETLDKARGAVHALGAAR